VRAEGAAAEPSDSDDAPAPAADRPASWALGLGVELPGSQLRRDFAESSNREPFPEPRLSLFGERRLGEGSWLTGVVSAGYRGGAHEPGFAGIGRRRLTGRFAFGGRHALNPGDLLQLSLAGEVGAFVDREVVDAAGGCTTDGSLCGYSSGLDMRTYGMTASVGVLVDVAIVAGLGARLGSPLGRFQYQRAGVEPGHGAVDSVFLELALEPTAALRYAF
jgi:hypothetical protein